MKEDEDIQKKIAAQIASSSEAVKVIELKVNQHALDLWEGLCEIDGPIPDDPLLLLPDSYAFSGERRATLKRLAEVYWANFYVRLQITTKYA